MLATIDKGSLSIECRIEERSICSFSITDPYGTTNLVRGIPVYIYDGPTIVFSGYIHTPTQSRLSPFGGRVWQVTCVDQKYLADKLVAAEAYVGWTAGAIAGDLFYRYLQAEGITLGDIQTGVVIEQVVINYARIPDVMTALAEASGFIWDIDERKRLFFIDRATYAAPWTLTTDDIIKGSASVADSNPLYRNRQFVRGATALTSTQHETFTGDGFQTSFFVAYIVNQTPTITVGGVAQTVGENGVDTGTDWYWFPETAELFSWTAPALGAAIAVAYIGKYPTVVMGTDASAITARQLVEGGTGYTDDVADTTGSESDAVTTAAAKLAEYCRTARRLKFSTLRSGLKPGQLLTVDYPLLGLTDTDALIESVSITREASDFIYSVTAIEGPTTGSWAQYFHYLGQAASPEPLTLGADPPVVILDNEAEGIGWHEDATETVYACPVPSTTLYPSVSLLPC